LHNLENCKAKFKIAWVRIRAGLTDWDIAKAQKCREGNRQKTPSIAATTHRPTPRLSEGETD
jgi:hypothetical protein